MDGAKTAMKMTMAIQAMKNMYVGRQPKRSWANELMTRPASSPTRAEFARPDCHAAVICFCPLFGSTDPNRSLNWVCPKKPLIYQGVSSFLQGKGLGRGH